MAVDGGEALALEREFSLFESENCPFWGHQGEILFKAGGISIDMARKVRDIGIRISSFSRSEILGATENHSIDFRWTKRGGRVEMVVRASDTIVRYSIRRLANTWRSESQAAPKQAPRQEKFPHWGETRVPLSGTGLEARIKVWKEGQRDILYGDDLIVAAEISLPAVGRDLHPHLAFGDRLTLLGSALYPYWGTLSEQAQLRFKQHSAFGATWNDAAWKAWEFVYAEIQKLNRALEKRARMLEQGG